MSSGTTKGWRELYRATRPGGKDFSSLRSLEMTDRVEVVLLLPGVTVNNRALIAVSQFPTGVKYQLRAFG